MSYEEIKGMETMQKEEARADMRQAQVEQREKKVRENQKADRKAFGKYLLILALSLVGGFVTGFVSAMTKGKQDMLVAGIRDLVSAVAPFGSIVLTTIVLVVVVILMKQAHKLYAAWDGEDEDLIEKVEMKLTWGMIFTSINMILGYLFFSLGIYAIESDNPYQISGAVRLAFVFVGLFYTLIAGTVLQNRIVNFTKVINPEKQGSIYDSKFQKIWMASMDESELRQAYQAGYKAFQTGGHACIVLWLFSFVGMIFWDFGVVPILMVLTIWLVMTIRYHIECVRMSKH